MITGNKAKSLSKILSVCALCCALPYLLLFTGLIGASTAAYLSGTIHILIAAILIGSVVLVLMRRQSRD